MSEGVRPIHVREDLAKVLPYGAPQLDVAVRLNTNETAQTPPQVFTSVLAARLDGLTLNRYPDRQHHELRQRQMRIIFL